MISYLLTRFKAIKIDMGWADGLLYLTARAIESASLGRIELRKYYFVSQPVSERLLLPANRGLSILVQLIDRHHHLVEKFPRPTPVIARRFDSGALCFLASRNDHFIGFLWLQNGSYMEDEVRGRFTPLPEGTTMWDFDVHVEPGHRSTFAFARLWDTANDFLRRSGVKWTVSRISAFNPGSINSHVRLGAFPVASACFINGRQWQIMLSGTPPYFHFSAGEQSVPELRLPAMNSNRKWYSRFAA